MAKFGGVGRKCQRKNNESGSDDTAGRASCCWGGSHRYVRLFIRWRGRKGGKTGQKNGDSPGHEQTKMRLKTEAGRGRPPSEHFQREKGPSDERKTEHGC